MVTGGCGVKDINRVKCNYENKPEQLVAKVVSVLHFSIDIIIAEIYNYIRIAYRGFGLHRNLRSEEEVRF